MFGCPRQMPWIFRVSVYPNIPAAKELHGQLTTFWHDGRDKTQPRGSSSMLESREGYRVQKRIMYVSSGEANLSPRYHDGDDRGGMARQWEQ